MVDWWPRRVSPARLQCIVFASVAMLAVESSMDWLRLIVLMCLGSPSSVLLGVLGKAVGREREAFAMGTVGEKWWLFLPAMIMTNTVTFSAVMAAFLHTVLSARLDPMVSGLTVLTITKMSRNVDSIILACGLISTTLLYLTCRYHKRLLFRDALQRFTIMFAGSTVLCCAVMGVDLVSPYLSKSALSIYGYWIISLLWMFYLSSLIPIKFQPSRFRLYMSRKLYHFAAFSMFAPTLIMDRRVTVTAMAAVLMLFIGTEVCRLQSDGTSDKDAIRFTKYLSQHLTIEEGALRTDTHPITSHISLLAGCFLPAFFAAASGDDDWSGGWAEMAGILSVGIGDAMACLFGIMFGRLRVNLRTGKTMEGMMAGWGAMCLVRLMIRPLPWHPWLVLVDGVTSGVEAINQADGCNDNLLMPLVSFALVRGMQYS